MTDRKLKNIIFLILSTIIITSCVHTKNHENIDAANTASLQWLNAIEAANYTAVFSGLSSMLSDNVTYEIILNRYKQMNENLGKVVQRELSLKTFTETLNLPFPDGEYVVLDYTTEFERKESAVETVILSKESNEWKVIGHGISGMALYY